ncbi:hypothetical protein [Flexivirga caeni]|uniref:DSBA-like thioredoxin domain-containing protein n=1 Tax=Flexivirga caeni TaxID=2294115 RepID=A0A3M9MBM0_9MICO|nr:hypothetical protein [Flexivirga caeni]RNI22946.1 hypothetical protein EFY87_09085 [Flexivirga caeni]
MHIAVWSELHCPWALLTVDRLRQARERHGLNVVFVPRAWPLEWVNHHGTPRHIVAAETAALGTHEPELFLRFTGSSWPSTFLPAFELVAATRRTHGLRSAEDVDYALRLAFFRHGVDVSIQDGLERALELAKDYGAQLNTETVLTEWLRGNPRSDVVDDYVESGLLPIQGSPQVFWPDGTTTHNPGMTDHKWIGDHVELRSTDPGAVERLLLERCGD